MPVSHSEVLAFDVKPSSCFQLRDIEAPRDGLWWETWAEFHIPGFPPGFALGQP